MQLGVQVADTVNSDNSRSSAGRHASAASGAAGGSQERSTTGGIGGIHHVGENGAARHVASEDGAARHVAGENGAARHVAGGSRNRSAVERVWAGEDLIRVKHKRKSHPIRRVVLTALIAALVVVAGAGAAAALYVNSLNSSLSIKDPETTNKLQSVLAPAATETAAATSTDAFYMLVIGSDARATDTASRSDVMILTRVEPSTGTITMVSIPRDTMVELPSYGLQKMNAAYAYDGAAGAVGAISEFANVPITHYAEIHFSELEELVDSLGGIWVDVPVSNDETGSSNTGVLIEAGNQLLNGQQALAFARERYGYTRGDFQRSDNQRLVAQAIVKKILELPAFELPGAVQQAAECVSTDLSATDILVLAQKFQAADSVTYYSAMTPSSTMTVDGVSYAVTDTAAWAAMMKQVDSGADPNASAG